MKIGFLLNISFLVGFIMSHIMVWLLDGTLVKTLAQLLNIKPYSFDKEVMQRILNKSVENVYHNITT